MIRPAETFRAYDMTTAEVESALARAPRDHALVISGTGLITLPAILKVRESAAAPLLLSSNICCAWRVIDHLGLPAGAALAAACPALAATLRGDGA